MDNTVGLGDLKGKVAAVTGGGGIIGAALVRGLASAGVRCAVLDLKAEAAEKTARQVQKETGVTTLAVAANVLDRASLDQARAAIHEKLGRVQILVNCAGGNSPKATTRAEFAEPANLAEPGATFFDLEIDGFRQVFDLNFLGTLLPTMVLGRDMAEGGGGAVLNISSMNALRPLTRIPAYSAAKASINNFTQWLAVHLSRFNVRVNAIAPGFLLTDQNRFLLTDKETGALTDRGRKIIAHTPLGRFGEPEEMVGTVCYLLSDMARFVTGVVIPVNGGFNAYSGV